MGSFILIAKTVLCSILSAGVIAAILAKIETMINPPHAHLGVGMVVMLLTGYAVVAAFVCSLIGVFIWRNSLDINWLKVVIGAVSIAEVLVLAFLVYGYLNR